MNHKVNKTAGFTLFELIVVMLLVGILAVFAAPRLNLTTFRETGFYQQAFSAIRHAQKRAISSGCTVQVSITGSGCNLNWVGCAGNAAILNPADNSADFCGDSTPAGSVTNGVFQFDTIGRPIPNSIRSINVGGKIIVVEAETGYAHD